METRIQEIAARGNKSVKIGVIPGHFATNHSHVNYYVDMTSIKSFHRMAKNAAVELARRGDFDLVILDWMMPEKSGSEACMEIRTFSDVPMP